MFSVYLDGLYRYGENATSETQHERNLSYASEETVSLSSLVVDISENLLVTPRFILLSGFFNRGLLALNGLMSKELRGGKL